MRVVMDTEPVHSQPLLDLPSETLMSGWAGPDSADAVVLLLSLRRKQAEVGWDRCAAQTTAD